MRTILAVNAGSSSLKLSLFDAADLARVAHESFGDLDGNDELRRAAVDGIGDWCRRHDGGRNLVAAGHRIVHGGAAFAAPIAIDDVVLAALHELVPLAPLHQPLCLAPVEGLKRSDPALRQVACFDTAFHHGRAAAVERYGLPERLWQDGVRRYGFHGLSCESVMASLPRLAPEVAKGRIIVAHLGSGASLTAVRDGRPVDTTMGFSALSGVVMSTRCGDLDPGVVLHLLRDGRRSVADVERMLYRESGLRGISGLSGDVRELLADASAAAREALDVFVLRIAREIGALTAMLGGLDAVVFTAGIGEHSAELRGRIVEASAWAGMRLDDDANARGGPCITRPGTLPAAWVVPTDEERTIAAHTRDLVTGRTS
jgi:acetate kinase